jgi:hypothetical protein
VHLVECQPTFQRNMSPTYSGSTSKSRKKPPTFSLVSCFVYSSIIMMEATVSSETSVDFQRTARRYIQEDRTFQHESY